MKKTTATVSKASRNLADRDDRPHNESICVGRDLAEVLAKANLPEKEARAWHRDLKAARQSLTAPAGRRRWKHPAK